jgi:hypothetical protein
MVVLIVKDPIFCQPFGRREMRKLTDLNRFCLNSSGVYSSSPIAVAIHGPFLILNLMVFNNSYIFESIVSESLMKTGYLLTLLTILPTALVNLSFKDSDTKRTSYFLAHFFTSLVSLANLLISSIFEASSFKALA